VTPHYYASARHLAENHRLTARQQHDRIARQLYHQAFGPRPGLVRRNIHWIASALITAATLLFLGASI